MNQHATPKGDALSGTHQPVSEEEGENPSSQSPSTSELEETLHQLDILRYRPRRETLRAIFKYADIPPKCQD